MANSRSRVRRFAASTLIAAGLGLLAVVGWRWAAGPESSGHSKISRRDRPVLLITVDTTRPDHLEPYGAEAVETPALARLAGRGVVFENAYSVAPITLVAHTSILTGLEPPRHGVRNNGLHYVPAEVTTLAERLRAEGYATAAFVSAAVLDRRYGLDQGFDVYDDDLSTGRERHPRMVADRPAEAVVAAAASWLDTAPDDRPFFLWVHFYDPHAAYSPPPPFRDRYRERLYDGEIAYMDSQIGRLLRHPRLGGDTVVSVLGDHGESLGEHGEQTHALLAYDATLHVPWILSVPGGPRGTRLSQTVGQVDLVPTLLDLLGHGIPEGGAGVSLLPLLEDSSQPLQRSLYAETFLPFYTYGWARLRVLRQGRYKWIDGPDAELYDTGRDPRELADVREQEPGLAHDLARDLREHLQELGGQERESRVDLDAEGRERLRSLGYLAAGSGTPRRDGAELPDPKSMIDLHVGLERARSLMRDRLFPQAVATLEGVLRRDPNNLAALMDLSSALTEMGELNRAAEVTERALALDPEYPRLYLQMATVEARRAGPERAVELLDEALRLDPQLVEALLRKALQLRRAGRGAEMVRTLDRALEVDPDSPAAHVLYARLVELPRDPAAAETRVRTALERDPFLVSGWQLLGEILEATGRPGEALAAYRSGLERQPDHGELHARLGIALARSGSGAEAEAHLREALRLSTEERLEVRVTLGAWLAEHGRFEEAQREYERVLQEQPDHPAARNNRAIALYRTGRLEQAEAELLDLVERHPRHADAHNNLAAIALERRRFAVAAERSRRALALQPRMAEGWNNLGLAQSGLGAGEEARKSFERALELSPGYWQARLNLGVLLARSGEPRAAADALEEVVTQMPRLPDAHLQLGRLYGGPLADPQRARTHYNAFLRQAPVHPAATAARRELIALDVPAHETMGAP